jgi:splicing factor 3B subunit 2
MGKDSDQDLDEKNGIHIKKLDKNEKEKIRKALKKKQKKLRKKNKNDIDGEDISDTEIENETNTITTFKNVANDSVKPTTDPSSNNVEIEFVERDEYLLTGKYYEDFKHVFQHFQAGGVAENGRRPDDEDEDGDQADQDGDPTKGTNEPLSRKKKKLLKRLKVAQLKALVKRPDVVEVWDTTAPDPVLLVYMKAYKNSVPVPRHWCQKRKFLQNKRGILKPPFRLPENIEKTGISRLRDPFNDREAGRLIRQKLRERMNPKLGKIDIDYEVLHDAFFKNQSKSKLSIHGDIYYEGKEDEVKMRSYKPGRISEELRVGLGISEYAPPPWIINMQRYGPPPSYPNLKIPGVNCPLPEGGHYGSFFQRPLDEHGKPIQGGNIYGTMRTTEFDEDTQPTDKALWGEIMEEEMVDGDDYEKPTDLMETAEPKTEDIRSGISSIISGLDTPENDIRKSVAPSKFTSHAIQNINYTNDPSAKPLYQVLEPVQTNVGGGLYGSSHGYIIPGVNDHLKNPSKDDKKNDDKGFKF